MAGKKKGSASTDVVKKKELSEEAKKEFDKSIRPLLSTRQLLYDAEGNIDVDDEDFLAFIKNKDAVVDPDAEGAHRFVALQYSSLVRSKIHGETIRYIRKNISDIDQEVVPLVKPVLVTLAALYSFVKNDRKIGQRLYNEYEALFLSSQEELKSITASALKDHSPLIASGGEGGGLLGGKRKREEDPVKDPEREEGTTHPKGGKKNEGKGGGGGGGGFKKKGPKGGCFTCHGDHFQNDCPMEKEKREATKAVSEVKPSMKEE